MKNYQIPDEQWDILAFSKNLIKNYKINKNCDRVISKTIIKSLKIKNNFI